jgi:SP family xylose:H+ symportor-like MFS transporter
MQTVHSPATDTGDVNTQLNAGYIWGIASVAALGGLLFGYDWVVIGGAKPFYESFFHLTSEFQVGWANGCALIGCLLGSLAAGKLSDSAGRKKTLLCSALLFTLSSLLTGWSYSFVAFIFWRIAGGVAIGLASNVCPTYIAEISPSQWRGKLISLNQLALVSGILMAQIANFAIARKVVEGASALALEQSWNVQYGWRWMFTAVALPGVIFFFATLLIPESPRWQMVHGFESAARLTLNRIGGPGYADHSVATIHEGLKHETKSRVAWRELFAPSLRRVLLIGITLAVIQQWSGINILFNYAEEVFRSAGYGVNEILFNIVITGAINFVFTIVAMACVDLFGRRSIMLFGTLGVGVSHLLAAFAYSRGMRGPAVLILTLSAIACYAVSLAPITWVLIAEIFPNRVRGLAVSIAVAALWASSFALTYSFPFLNRALGTGGTFSAYAAICLFGAVFVYRFVPETKGRSLEEIEELFNSL